MGERTTMKKIILDIFKYSGVSFFATFSILVALIIPNGVNSFLNGTTFQAPLNLLTISGIANGSENSLEIHFTRIFFWQILLLYTCLTFMIFGIVYAKKNKKAVYLVISLAAMVTLVLGSTQLSRIQQEPLKTTTIQSIDSIMDSKGNSIVYIGRENCPDCILYKPKLISYLEKEKLEINFLDTTGNKTDVDNFRKYYNKLGVESIPAVIFIKNGKVERILYGDKEAENIERTIKLFKTS